VANSETPAAHNAQGRICGKVGVEVAQAPVEVEVEACIYFAANSEEPAVRSSIPNGEYEIKACEKASVDPAQATVVACLTMREPVLNEEKDETCDPNFEKPVGTRTNAGGSEEYYTVEQQLRLGVDETGKPIQDEGKAKDHSEALSLVETRYPGIPRVIKVHAGPPIKSNEECKDGVYYLTGTTLFDSHDPIWKRRDQCAGHSWIVVTPGSYYNSRNKPGSDPLRIIQSDCDGHHGADADVMGWSRFGGSRSRFGGTCRLVEVVRDHVMEFGYLKDADAELSLENVIWMDRKVPIPISRYPDIEEI